MHTLYAYLLAFAVSLVPVRYQTPHRLTEVRAIVTDVVSTDGTVDEDLELVGVAWEESRFERRAHGRKGEIGAWQIMPPARSFGADEALRRLRVQGIQGYCGCVRPCPLTVERRTWPARLWRMAFDPPINS